MTARHRASDRSRARRAGAAGCGVLSLLLLAAALLLGPPPAGASAAQPDGGSGTLLRLAQLTPDLPDVELRVSSVRDPRRNAVAGTLRYGEMSPYRPVEPGDYVVTMRPAGSTAPPQVSRTLTVQPGTAYTVASVRHQKNADDLGIFTDDLAAPAPDRARLRVINAAPPAPQLDVRDATQSLADGLAPGRAGPYRDVPPGRLTLTVTPPGGPDVELPVSVAANQVASVVLTSSDAGPRAMLVVDANGPSQVPPGPVHAGVGGAAGGAPGAAAGSVVLAVLAAAAFGVSVRLARR